MPFADELKACFTISYKSLTVFLIFCVNQDFEALTPNLLARTIETVEGGGIVVILLRTMNSLKQLYAMTMVCVCGYTYMFVYPVVVWITWLT